MNKTKETLVTAFALFSLFFGAGNLILPPLLGFKSGEFWWLVTLGFCLSAVLIPILGILAHAKLQGTMFDFGKKVSPAFAIGYSFVVYAISIALPSPRTASVTHEIAIQPFFESPYWVTSIVYFVLVFVFVMNRSRILDIIGKFLTPAIIIILLLIMGIATYSYAFDFGDAVFANPFADGILEGYQTFDAIGAVVVGGVIIISINLKNKEGSYEDKKRLIRRAGWLAGLGLFLIYAGLIFTGALMHDDFEADISRTALLNGISIATLGNTANLFLSILVSFACFTTAVGIVTGTADFMKYKFGDSQKAYMLTAILGCILGVVMGQFNVGYIIVVAIPALALIYPVTIVLIFLNVLPERYSSALVFKWVVITTLLFSLPEFIHYGLGPLDIGFGGVRELFNWLPLSAFGMGWVLPAGVVFTLVNAWVNFKNET
ncbi:MAG: branched-chain amino acid transport system II carrier protein [Maribacter sp.]|nr:branched-chain amino acid transport system II carrier protein [Maribacter sp.]